LACQNKIPSEIKENFSITKNFFGNKIVIRTPTLSPTDDIKTKDTVLLH